MIEHFLDGLGPMLEEPVGGSYMAVLFPEDVDPFERHYRYGVMLDAELRLARVGCSDGGGTLFDTSDDEGEPEVMFTVLDIDATDIDGARAVLRLHLPELGCCTGTLLLYGDDHEDRFDGAKWHLAQPRSVTQWPF